MDAIFVISRQLTAQNSTPTEFVRFRKDVKMEIHRKDGKVQIYLFTKKEQTKVCLI